MTNPDGRKPTFSLLAWLLQAFAGIIDLFTSSESDEEAINDAIMDDADDYTRYAFQPEEAALAALVGDIETTVYAGYDTESGSLVIVVAKPDVDTATINVELPDGIVEVRSMRPDLFGQVMVSMQSGGQFANDPHLALIMKNLVASGFLTIEGYNGRPEINNTDIETVVIATAVDTSGDFTSRLTEFGYALKLDGKMVRSATIHYGRLLFVTDEEAILTHRVNAAMMDELAQKNGDIPAPFVYEGKKVGLDHTPLNVVKTGKGVVIGLSDESTNIAIAISPTGKFEVEMQTGGALGALTSMFASIAERSTGTAIVTRDGQLGRVSLAALTPRFRQLAGIAIEGNGAGKTTQLQA